MSLSLARNCLLGGVLFIHVAAVLAQAAPRASTSAASQPSVAIGVLPKAAASAADRAIPRSDVATLVRTGPSAADKARVATQPGGSVRPNRAASAASSSAGR